MKKLLFIIILLVVGYTVQAQKDTTTVTGTTTEKLIDKYSAKIEASIISLAQSLKQPAEHVYKVLVKQQIVWGIATLLIALICGVTLILAIKGLQRYDKAHKKDSSWDKDNSGWWAFVVFAAIFFGISIIVFVIVGLTGLINPEYGALKDIVDMIK